MKIYSGKQTITYKVGKRTVTDFRSPISLVYVDDKILPSKMIEPKSNTKFRTYAWGYHGIYPTNLAVSILCNFFDVEDYMELYSDKDGRYVMDTFYDYVCQEKNTKWTISEKDMHEFVQRTIQKSDMEEQNEKQELL